MSCSVYDVMVRIFIPLMVALCQVPRLSQARDCQNKNWRCRIWSINSGCQTKFMLSNCPKTCNSCPERSCQDLHAECHAWSRNNECRTRPYFMLRNCPSSCSSCSCLIGDEVKRHLDTWYEGCFRFKCVNGVRKKHNTYIDGDCCLIDNEVKPHLDTWYEGCFRFQCVNGVRRKHGTHIHRDCCENGQSFVRPGYKVTHGCSQYLCEKGRLTPTGRLSNCGSGQHQSTSQNGQPGLPSQPPRQNPPVSSPPESSSQNVPEANCNFDGEAGLCTVRHRCQPIFILYQNIISGYATHGSVEKYRRSVCGKADDDEDLVCCIGSSHIIPPTTESPQGVCKVEGGQYGEVGFCKQLRGCQHLFTVYETIRAGYALQDVIEEYRRYSRICRGEDIVCCAESGTRSRATTASPSGTGIVNTGVPTAPASHLDHRHPTTEASPSNPQVPRATASASRNPVTITPSSLQEQSKLPERCGISGLADRIINGEKANLGAWPWMVILMGRDSTFRSKWVCGGSLISESYVLTAAHCFIGNVQPRIARIGEHDLRVNPDCKGRVCAPNHQDIPIFSNSIIRHPDYDKPCKACNDIALIRLSRNAILHEKYVMPICLPQPDMGFSVQGLMGKQAWAAGWGTIDEDPEKHIEPNILQQVQLPIRSNAFCEFTQRTHSDPSQVFCAGGEGRDTCRGDSGGPLTLKNDGNRHFLVGITTKGPRKCGEPNTLGFYTSVDYYLPWILENIA